MKNILIVDNDLGFVFWLCHVLDAAGYETVPARGVREAMAALEELDLWVDLLMVRGNLPGADGFATELRSSQKGQLKTIALIDSSDESGESIAAWDGWQVKLSVTDAIAGPIFLSLVHNALSHGKSAPGC